MNWGMAVFFGLILLAACQEPGVLLAAAGLFVFILGVLWALERRSPAQSPRSPRRSGPA